MKELTKEWLKAARDDLDVIERIITDVHLTHMVAFHAQQCVEKVFKALLEEHSIETPRIHRLVTLYGKIEGLICNTIDLAMLQTLDSLYIDARYPGGLGLLPDGRPTEAEAQSIHAFAAAMLQSASHWTANT